MFFDLNVPISLSPVGSQVQNKNSSSKKGKAKQNQNQNQAGNASAALQFTAAQLSAIEAHLDLLVHLGYTVLALNQTIHKKIDPKTHINILDILLNQLKPRTGLVLLKRLSVILDEDSEKGFGLTSSSTQLLASYDLVSLIPTTATTFSQACLTHTLPSSSATGSSVLTANIISLPLTLNRLPFHLKHTLVRTALRNGAMFEIPYVGAIGGSSEEVLVDAGAAEQSANAKRNWWAAAREVVRVTKGKGVVVSGGVVKREDLRGPKDVANLIALLGVAQDAAHAASTSVPKSLVLRAQTRKTYRAVLSEPRLVLPEGYTTPSASATPVMNATTSTSAKVTEFTPGGETVAAAHSSSAASSTASSLMKRCREDDGEDDREGGAVKDSAVVNGDAQKQVKVQQSQGSGIVQDREKGQDGKRKKKKRKGNPEQE
ncbi:PHP domain-like protein [Dendrothele bispora CBS 962.96]|uniref:PHP domain-like protein n=1 Tax=Dendrothele bispora (strain CBS 962.96) TaxID=1314807 RepID=A0A4S8MCS8_DENBC|nr:PHP domain-like protein [Dendrothele bispora CBS 962.96]